MSALQDSSHSREQPLDRKPADVSQHRLVTQQFDVISNNKIKTLTPHHQLLTQQNLATSVTIVSAALTPRVTLSSAILQQALGPRVAPSLVPRIESTTSVMSTQSASTGGANITTKMAFPPHLQQQQQMAVNLSSNVSSSVGTAPIANQSPASGQTLTHQGIYSIGSALSARQIPMVQPRMSTAMPLANIPKVAAISAISDLRMQTTPQSTPGSHIPKGAVAAATILSASKTGHAAIARPVPPSAAAAAIQVQPPMIGNLVIQSPAAQRQKIMSGAIPMTPSVPRSSLPTVSLITSSASRVASIGLQPQLPWSNSAAIQVPVIPVKSQAEISTSVGALSTANVIQQTIRPIGNLGTQQAIPLAIRPPTQKVLLTSPLTSVAPVPMSHSLATAAIANVTRVSDLAAHHSVVPTIARSALVPGTSLPMVSAPQGLPGGNSTAQLHPVSLAQNFPLKTQKVVLSSTMSKATFPVQSGSVSKMGGATLPATGVNLPRAKKNFRLQSATTSAVTHPAIASVAIAPVVAKAGVPVVSVQAMANVGIKPQQASATLSSPLTAVPVAKVPPNTFTVQQLSGDAQSAAACRLVSPVGQPLPQQQSLQQHPRPVVPPASQIFPLQQNALFLSSSCLSSTALPAALSLPMTSTDSRQPNEGPVLHQVSYAIPDGTRYLTPQHVMNLSSTYAGLQPVQALTLQASNIRPGSVTSQAPTLAASLQGSSNTVTPLSSVIGMTNQTGRLNTSVVVAMEPSRLASLTIPPNFAAGDVTTRAVEGSGNPIGMALNQGSILQQQQQPQQTVIALMQPPQPSTSVAADSVKQPTMSPRPPILRKRNHDVAMMSGAKKNLFSSVASLTNDPGGSTVVTSATDMAQLVLASPKSFDASRENSQSSTDTASSAESTPRSCPPSASRVKEEPQDCFENGITGNDPGLKIIPRKKPRKQSLHANEEIPDGFSSDEDEAERPSMNLSFNAEISPADEEPEHKGAFAPAEHVDDEGFRWTRTRPKNVTITGEYVWNSKSRNNHFTSFADVKLKDDRRPSVNELANMIGIQQNANGAKVSRLSDQFTQLIELETDDFDRMKNIQLDFPTKLSSKHCPDDDLRSVGEIVLANVQRCRSYIDQLREVQDSLNHIILHKQQAYEIITKHQSKRTVKKKERS